jgi:hypothetical protein
MMMKVERSERRKTRTTMPASRAPSSAASWRPPMESRTYTDCWCSDRTTSIGLRSRASSFSRST